MANRNDGKKLQKSLVEYLHDLIPVGLKMARNQGVVLMTLWRLVVVALLLLPALGRAAPPLEVKGVLLGAPAAAAEERFPYGLRLDESYTFAPLAHDRICDLAAPGCFKTIQDRYGFGPTGIPLKYRFTMRAGMIGSVSIEMASSQIAGTVAALTLKYGAPANVTVETWRNKAGGTFPNTVTKWRLTDGSIVAQERAETSDTSSVTMTATTFEQAEVEDARQRVRDAAKHM